MDKSLWRRRQLLSYLGLGIAGAGAVTVLSSGLRKKAPEAVGDRPSTPSDGPSASGQESAASPLPQRGRLPEFQGISQWLNSEPLSIGALQGNVVLVQFWTFACINCQRTLPSIVQWHQRYAAQGLKVIGIHTPEFTFERDLANVKRALQQHQITYPVPIDNGFKTWEAYRNQYWPHLFLADRQGFLRYDHIGEGAYAETEQVIQQLLRL